jgi:beta-lactamase superfamily II metal-dependent hydrolase
MKTAIRVLLVLAVASTVASAQSPDGDVLSIYLVDVEGGGATLYVSPAGESMLIDTGNGGANADRDVSRIMAAVEDAGLERIDHLLTTHWHGDHYGGLAELATRIPIGHYIDHGPTIEDNEGVQAFIGGPYRELHGAASRTVVVPGDAVPLSGVDVRVMASAGAVIDDPLPGAGEPNPYCADFERYPEDLGDNGQSAGVHLQFGSFRALHLGDLTANKEFELMCPNNPIGSVDLYVVSHHGLNTSNAQVLVHGVAPRVAIMNNGTRKGGTPDTMTTLHTAPRLQDLWQLHFSVLSGQEYTVPGVFIANPFDDQPDAMPLAPVPPPRRGSNAAPPPVHSGPAHWIKVEARRDGAFTVTNSRNGFSKSYAASE